MTRKALISGMISGLLLSLGLLYPTFVFYVYRINPLWFDADIRLAAITPGLLLSGLVAFFAVSGGGHLARHPRGCHLVVGRRQGRSIERPGRRDDGLLDRRRAD